jgi:3D (Asp-Asp-Asp) domain-containing protein
MLMRDQLRIVIREQRAALRRRLRHALTVMLLIIASGCAGGIHQSPPPTAGPEPSDAVATGKRVSFTATAYCSGTRTASGTKVAEGIAAADPALVPIGSVIQVSGLESRYNGIYTVMDTGAKIRGRRLDLYLRDCDAAVRFGRRSADVSIVRRGWHPRATPQTPQ